MKRVDEVFAFITTASQPEGWAEGILGVKTSDGWIPMIGADVERIESLVPIAESTGLDYKIIKFTNKVDVTEQFKGKRNEKPVKHRF